MSVHQFLKFPMNIIRPSNAYCPGQLLHRVIPKAVICGLKGEKLPLHGGGRRKNPTSTRAISAALFISLLKRRRSARSIMPVPALPTSIREVVERTAKALGMPFDQLCEVTRRPARPGFALLARLVGNQARFGLGAADRLGRRSCGDGGLGPQIFRRAEKLADRLHACVLEDVTVEASIATLRRNSLDRRGGAAALPRLSPAYPRYFPASRRAAHRAGFLLHRNHRCALQRPDAP